MEYTKQDGERLLKLAREAIEEEFSGKKPEIPKEKQFRQARGVFVTLTEKGDLRGCIGYPEPSLALNEAIVKSAKAAAFSDPRFSPLKQEEMKNIEIEISILTLPQKCDAKDIQVGKDGIICDYLGYSGLLLPQVAVEHKLNRIQFLEALCSKAGLPKDNWQNKNFKLYKFQAQIFK